MKNLNLITEAKNKNIVVVNDTEFKIIVLDDSGL